MAERVAHDALQSVQPSEHAFVHGEDCSQPPVQSAGEEAIPSAVSKVAPSAPSRQLRTKVKIGGGGGNRTIILIVTETNDMRGPDDKEKGKEKEGKVFLTRSQQHEYFYKVLKN